MARFIRRGKAKIYFLPTIAAATLLPTDAEITAGTDLTARIADMSGWMLDSAAVNTPDMASRFVSNIPGETTVAASSITFYADDAAAADAIKTALATDTEGFIYIAHSGRATGKTADTFPARVSSIGNEYSVGNDPARFVVNFAATAEPVIDGAQPATV
jgi:hypothetical protein